MMCLMGYSWACNDFKHCEKNEQGDKHGHERTYRNPSLLIFTIADDCDAGLGKCGKLRRWQTVLDCEARGNTLDER